jgi:DNA-binding GntR family transcriptional regulator
VKPLKKPTKSEKAYQGIKKLIISGGFSADRHWSFRTLAQRFRMSVAPITEAVRRLEQEGILTVKARQGIAVKRLSHKEIHEYTVLREGIEIQAARVLALRGGEEDMKELSRFAREIHRLVQKESFDEAAYQDYLLHRELVSRAGLPYLLKQFESLAVILFLTQDGWTSSVFTGDDPGLHEELILAIRSRDPETAERAIREHIRSISSREWEAGNYE